MGRSPCCEKNGLKKGPWTPEEDHKLITYIQKHGHGSWRTLPKNAGLARCGKSCRLRWTNYLRPDIKRGRFSFDEEETIIQLHSILGNKWSAIAGRLPGRTDNEIKNYWNTHIRKRLLRMGIDPVTHSPRLDLLDLSSILTNPSLFINNNNTGNGGIPSCQDIDYISRTLGLNPTDQLLRFASNLLASNNSQMNDLNSAFFVNNQSQFIQPNMPNMQSATTSYANIDQSMPYDQQYVSAEDSSAYVQNNNGLDYNMDVNMNMNMNMNMNASAASVMSTPISSSATDQLNSSSVHFNSSTEDERDSYCSELFNFQIPSLLDVSDFM